jgi:hypothetical protein
MAITINQLSNEAVVRRAWRIIYAGGHPVRDVSVITTRGIRWTVVTSILVR